MTIDLNETPHPAMLENLHFAPSATIPKTTKKILTKSSYEADIIPKLMLFYSRNTF